MQQTNNKNPLQIYDAHDRGHPRPLDVLTPFFLINHNFMEFLSICDKVKIGEK